MLHQRDSAQIRQDAIRMAIQKAQAGCPTCAQRYFVLAKQHGATEEEISAAINSAAEPTGHGMSRREVLKLAVAATAGLALGTSTLIPQHAEAYSTYWGTDSNTQSCCGIPQNFYIGRFGYGTTSSTAFFNTSAANAAGTASTYEYWGIEGPGNTPPGQTPYQWGYNQGSTAASQWYNNPNAGYVYGLTIFGDVESGFGGWGSNQYNNQQVVEGFTDGVVLSNNYLFYAGIYITPSDWKTFFGTSFITSQHFVLFLADCCACGISCAPCNLNCNTTLTQVQNLLPTTTNNIFGRSKMVLWQYWLDPPCGCGDFDVAIQNPANGFSPITSSTTYHSSCC